METIRWPHIAHRQMMEKSRLAIEEALALLRSPRWPLYNLPPSGTYAPYAHVNEELERE